MDLHPAITTLATACQQAGGRAWIVGGVVRDHLLGIGSKDVDVEVHGLAAEELIAVLNPLGSVNPIGKSFGVYKLCIDGLEIDVSIPRSDSQQGPGHTDVVVVGDPFMGIEAAARRRDLTINAIAYDPLTGEYADPFEGIQDLERGRLDAVDPKTFGEDPLRALRVVQFAARFGFSVHPDLVELCKVTPLQALPAERIWGEFEKLLMKAAVPSHGWALASEWGLVHQVLPEIATLPVAPVLAAIDAAAGRRAAMGERGRATALMLSALLHSASPEQAEQTLNRLGVHKLAGYRVRTRVIESVGSWRQLTQPCTDSDLRRLADRVEILVVCETGHAVSGSTTALKNLDQAERLGISEHPLTPLLHGRDLGVLGVVAGPKMGEALDAVREAQLDGHVSDKAGALNWLSAHLAP